MGNRALWLEIQYALAALGAWLIPLNTMLTAPELANLAAHSRMDRVIWADQVLDHDTTGRLREVLGLGARFERMIGVGDCGMAGAHLDMGRGDGRRGNRRPGRRCRDGGWC
jgi:hypothetical protein